MGDLKEDIIAKAMGMQEKPGESIDDVKQQAEHMTVIDETMETAKKLAGTAALETESARKDKRMETLEKDKDKATEQLHESQIQNVRTELGSKIDHLAESIEGGASKKSIGDQIGDIKKAANELGLGGSKVSEIKEIMGLVTSLNPKTNLAEQVKEARDLLTALQPAEDKGKEPLLEGVPASVAIELKKMDTNLQVTLEQMKDDRQRKDQEFQLTLRKYDDDRVARQQEVVGKIEVEKDRNELIAGGLETVGRAMGRGYAESGRGAGSSRGISQEQTGGPQPFKVTANEGESGAVDCPVCQERGTPNQIGIGPATTSAVCVGCGSQVDVERVPIAKSAGKTQSKEKTK